ncbi:hypothetical protein AALT52_00350 [Ligilactobacillus faecis]|uniref:Uncharacterized protein n=1 Tax=Ligilactobacillus faecis TaxID=762833 RepID=A0ABV4DLJ5_9LACO
MKLTVISITDPKDKHTWSGTTSNMYEAFSKAAIAYYKSDLNWDVWAKRVCKFLEN